VTRPAASPDEVPLELTGVWKAYPGVLAVRDADLRVRRRGEIHALVGENGAGKSTLMNVASGNVSPDRGEVRIAGRALTSARPAEARRLGLAMVYQDDSLVPDLSVAENLLLGVHAARRSSIRESNAWARSILDDFQTPIDPRTPVRELTVAARQMVEVLKALRSRPHVLVLDEPTAALTANEVERLHELLRAASASGTSIVYITHRLHEVFALADVVSVMRDGEMALHATPVADATEDQLVTLMVGRSLRTFFPERPAAESGREPSEPRLLVRALESSRFRDVEFEVRRGEIVGLAGIEGNGQLELLRALAGLGARRGAVEVDGRPLHAGDVRDARRHGLVFISGDRRGESLFPTLGVRENIAAGNLQRLATWGMVPRSREARAVSAQIDALDIRTSGLEQNIVLLSGGNQQKVALARAFLATPRVYVVQDPTQGVDAGARAELYRLLRDAASAGGSVVVLSSDAVELAGLCDRVLVFARGEIARELQGAELTEEAIVAAAVTTRLGTRETRGSTDRGARRWPLLDWARTSDFAPIALLVASILLIGALTGLARPSFFTTDNIGNLLFLAVPLGFAALGQAAVMLIGGIDLSIGPLIALTTVAIAQIMSEDGGRTRSGLAIAAALAIGLGLGLLNGLLVRRVHILPLIATLATYILVQGLALLWLSAPGGYVSSSLVDGASARIGFVPWAVVLLLAVASGLELAYRRTIPGLWYRAVGSRPQAAYRLGAPSETVQYAAYALAGLLGAAGGIFFASTIGIGDPALGVSFTLASIAAVVLGGLSTWGGRGSIVGPLLGALLLALVANASSFLNLPAHTQLYVQGGLVLFAIGLYSRLRATGAARDETIVR
jgi:ribose transport system ATP-binding protein